MKNNDTPELLGEATELNPKTQESEPKFNKMDILKNFGVGIMGYSTVFTIAFIITFYGQKRPFGQIYTEDYLNIKYKYFDGKIEDYKDSVIKYRALGSDGIANKYTDSANKFIDIKNFLIQ